MSLRDIETSLPPGFRFFPNDEELVCHYLHKKSSNEKISNVKMVEVNLHICEPWQLPDVAKLDYNVWYFFSFRDRKYATGFRSNRTTTAGFWKATGKDRPIYDSGTNLIVGMRKTLVFYIGRAPNGAKTDWIMHEFRVENAHMPPKEEWVLCRVIHKGNREFTTKGGLDNYYNDKMANSSNLLPLGDELTPIGSKMVPQCSYNQHNGVITLPSLAPFDATSLQFPQREWCVSNSETGSRIEDKLMFDMISENDVLGIGEAATFDMMRF